MPAPDNRVTWVNSTGVPLAQGAPATPGETYYGEVPSWAIGLFDGFAVSLVWDAVEAATYTLDSANDASLTAYAALGTGWVSQATALGTITAAPPTAATGSVTFSRTVAAAGAGNIPASTIIETPGGVQFTTDALVAFGALDLAKVANVTAVIAGVTGNVAIGAISVIPPPPLFDPIITVSNGAAFTTGVGSIPNGDEWQIADAESSRWRVVRVAGAAGVSTARWTVKGIA